MVAANPLFAEWTAKKFRATVVNDIWPEVLFFTSIATMVYLVSSQTSHSLAISSQMLTVLGTVLGLVVSFRTSSAYERFQDGRKMWTNITLASRNTAMFIWIHVPFEREDKDHQKKQSIVESVIEKKTMINLVQAFSVSVKHCLRSEPGIYYEDLYPLICFLPRYATHPPELQTELDMLPLWRASDFGFDTTPTSNQPEATPASRHKLQRTESPSSAPSLSREGTPASWYSSFRKTRRHRRFTFDPEQALPVVTSDRPLRPARNPPSTSFYDYLPFLRLFKPLHKLLRPASKKDEDRTMMGRKRKVEAIESNVPLEITLYLSSYFAWLLRAGLVQPVVATGLANGITSMQDSIANLERIRSTPLPFAYQAHLRMSMWLYLFFLPFQIYDAFNYLTIPATAFASFLLLGFLEIGQEIENPFNYDLNDLDLDHFCLSIQREMHEITAHTSPEPSSYIFTPWNQPFAPADRRDAEQMTRDRDHAYWGKRNTNGSGSGSRRRQGRRDLNGHGDAEKAGLEESEHGHGESEDEVGNGVDGVGMTSIRRTLLKNWKDVDDVTRHPAIYPPK